MKFLHIADVHLGCTRYHLEESQRDFFDAWIDVLKKYAVDERVDFVIMCGDFFHKRSVPPETMNYAFAGLSMLKDAGIPVVSIEGNHDQKHNDSDYSWLRSLANWNLLYLLEPKISEGEINYLPWNSDDKRGGFIDIGEARIFGSDWFGASANNAIPKLTESIGQNQREGAFHILMLHTDVEGHQTHPIPALTIENLKKLRSVTNYVGLGHTHKCFDIENWAFNPGSLEITAIDEFKEIRGAWLVEVDEAREVSAKHIQEYVQRPFQRISFDVDKFADTKELTKQLLETVENELMPPDEVYGKKPIIEITLRGHLGFPNSNLELDKIRRKTQEIGDALHVKIRNHSVPIEYGDDLDVKDQSREAIELSVVERFVAQDNRYKTRAKEVTETVIGAKRMVLGGESPEKIADFIALGLADGNKEKHDAGSSS
ncbi:MAG: exonuclease SbcCD subunit D [Acidobacteria bacterium]|nr:exonuclease SbcCD subunit D [Acidobacteriota bacterium]